MRSSSILYEVQTSGNVHIFRCFSELCRKDLKSYDRNKVFNECNKEQQVGKSKETLNNKWAKNNS